MALSFNNTNIPPSGNVIFNGTHCKTVTYNGTEVWKKNILYIQALLLLILKTLDMPHTLLLQTVVQTLRLTHLAAQNEDMGVLCLVDLAQ